MSNYTKQISWSGKDALSDSDSEKVISGGDFDTEFSAVQTAINSKIDDIVDDTTPQLGGDLDLNGNDITGTGAIPSANLSGALPAIDGSSLTGVNIYPTSSSHLFATSDAQNIDTALSAGTYIFVSVTRSGVAQSEVGYIVSDGSTLTTVSHASQTGSIDWTNPSGTTLRIRDVNNDKELLVFGWRIR